MTATCEPATDDAIGRGVRLLAAGALAIIPTDTVYGIAADSRVETAVRELYRAKSKPETEPLQLLFGPDLAMVRKYADLGGMACRLVEAWGPGPWTIIAPVAPGGVSIALSGGATVGFRIPAARVVHRLVGALGAPLAASSANQHGQPSPQTCQEAVANVGGFCALALDDGSAPEGLDSTVIDCTAKDPRILREGAIDRREVARILGVRDIPVLRSVRT